MPAPSQHLERHQAYPHRDPARGVVLVVDDEPIIARVAAWFLERLGHEVMIAVDPTSARELLETRKFDLLMTDLMMPGQDGIAFGEESARRHPGLRLLLCTGLADSDTARRAAAAGFHGVVGKPFDREKIARAVRGALQSRTAEAAASDHLERHVRIA